MLLDERLCKTDSNCWKRIDHIVKVEFIPFFSDNVLLIERPSRSNHDLRPLDLLFDIAVQYPAAATAVMANRQMLSYEPLARELGALAFAVSPFDLEGLRELAVRHLAQSAIEAIDVRQRIWENLPWGGK